MFGAIHRWITSAGWIFAAAVFFLIFLGTGIAALYMYLLRHFPPAGAMGIVAGASAVIGVIAVLISARASTTRSSGWEEALKHAAAKDPLGTAVGALAIGLIIESSPELGRIIHRLLGRAMH
jgi:hypothetical protein